MLAKLPYTKFDYNSAKENKIVQFEDTYRDWALRHLLNIICSANDGAKSIRNY